MRLEVFDIVLGSLYMGALAVEILGMVASWLVCSSLSTLFIQLINMRSDDDAGALSPYTNVCIPIAWWCRCHHWDRVAEGHYTLCIQGMFYALGCYLSDLMGSSEYTHQ